MVKTFLRETEVAILQRKKSSVGGNASRATDGESAGETMDPSSVLCVAYVRTFHQSLMVGLIESSKGVREMFLGEDAGPSPGGGGGSVVTGEGEEDGMTLATAYDELQAAISIVIPEYLKCITKVLNDFFQRYDYEYGLITVRGYVFPHVMRLV